MVLPNLVREMALAYEGAIEQAHFEKTSFRVKKKIFATMDEKKQQVVLKLSEIDQSVFSAFDATAVYPVPGAWGKKGWTIVELKLVRKDLFEDALNCSYRNVAPRKLAEKYPPREK